jgi:hypothetical protein
LQHTASPTFASHTFPTFLRVQLRVAQEFTYVYQEAAHYPR